MQVNVNCMDIVQSSEALHLMTCLKKLQYKSFLIHPITHPAYYYIIHKTFFKGKTSE